MASPPVIPTCSTCPSSRNGDRSATGTCRRQLGRVQFVLCHDPFRRVQQAFWYEWHAGGTAGLRRRRDREITCFPTRIGTSSHSRLRQGEWPPLDRVTLCASGRLGLQLPASALPVAAAFAAILSTQVAHLTGAEPHPVVTPFPVTVPCPVHERIRCKGSRQVTHPIGVVVDGTTVNVATSDAHLQRNVGVGTRQGKPPRNGTPARCPSVKGGPALWLESLAWSPAHSPILARGYVSPTPPRTGRSTGRHLRAVAGRTPTVRAPAREVARTAGRPPPEALARG